MATVNLPEKGSSKLLSDNSNKSKERAANKKTQIATGKMRSKSLAMKFAEVFFEGSLNDAIDYMINDVAIPQIKNAALKGLEVIFYGGVNGSSSNRSSSSNLPYNSYYVGRDGTKKQASSGSSRGKTDDQFEKIKKRFDPRMIIVEDRGEAQRVLADLKHDCNEFGQVSVYSLFEMVGIDSDWTSTSYGWCKGDLDNAKVRSSGSGWWFDLPEPYQID